MKLQTEEIQIHAEEMSNLRKELEDERWERINLEERVMKATNVTHSTVTSPSHMIASKAQSRMTQKHDDNVGASDIRRQVCVGFF